MRSFLRRLGRLSCLVPLVSLQGVAQTPPARPPLTAADAVAALEESTADRAKPQPAIGKLDPPLQAVASAWRRLGIKGAERECGSRNITLDRLRVPAVIHVDRAERRREVEKALRRAWGDVVASDRTLIHAWLPVPALRRMSRMSAVQAIYLDSSVSSASGPARERLR
jgi:hypothetical protein